jgi:hypothetical protein
MEVSGRFMPQLFYPQGKSPWYPLDRRQSCSGFSGIMIRMAEANLLDIYIHVEVIKMSVTHRYYLTPIIC